MTFMSKGRRSKTVVVALGVLGIVACASQLDRIRTKNSPQGRLEGVEVDTSLLIFENLETSAKFSLRDYFDATGREVVVLSFGSMSCASCNAKSRTLSEMDIASREYLVVERDHAAEIVGVNTDTRPKRSAVVSYLQRERFDFIRWSDPAGLTMIEHLLRPGDPYAIPFVAMLTRDRLLWSIPASEHASLEVILGRVSASLRLLAGDGEQNPAPTLTPTPPPPPGPTTVPSPSIAPLPPPVIPTGLERAGPGRLGSLPIRPCGAGDGAAATTSVLDYLGGQDISWIQIAGEGSCAGGVCSSNMWELQRFADSCGALRCRGMRLDTDPACPSGADFAGGREAWSVFETYFNWAYAAEADPESEGRWRWPAMRGPITLFFDGAGRLLRGVEGAVSASSLIAELGDGSLLGDPQAGARFEVWDREHGVMTWDRITRAADFTVLAIFDPGCTSCVEEIKAMVGPGGLSSICADSAGGCQFVTLEGEPDYLEGERSLEAYHEEIVAQLRENYGITTVRVLLDPRPTTDEGGAGGMAQRIFNGYLSSYYRDSWGNNYGAVVYDREGKIRFAQPLGSDAVPALLAEAVKALMADGRGGERGTH